MFTNNSAGPAIAVGLKYLHEGRTSAWTRCLRVTPSTQYQVLRTRPHRASHTSAYKGWDASADAHQIPDNRWSVEIGISHAIELNSKDHAYQVLKGTLAAHPSQGPGEACFYMKTRNLLFISNMLPNIYLAEHACWIQVSYPKAYIVLQSPPPALVWDPACHIAARSNLRVTV
jgi:hypothetical protein